MATWAYLKITSRFYDITTLLSSILSKTVIPRSTFLKTNVYHIYHRCLVGPPCRGLSLSMALTMHYGHLCNCGRNYHGLVSHILAMVDTTTAIQHWVSSVVRSTRVLAIWQLSSVLGGMFLMRGTTVGLEHIPNSVGDEDNVGCYFHVGYARQSWLLACMLKNARAKSDFRFKYGVVCVVEFHVSAFVRIRG
jgi:hypothetical protein